MNLCKEPTLGLIFAVGLSVSTYDAPETDAVAGKGEVWAWTRNMAE